MAKKNMMQAAVYQQYGPPDGLEIQSVPIPDYSESDVLIRVHYTTVNRTDCGFLRGEPFIVRFFAGLTKPNSTILGCEFSGVVEAIGDAVSDYQVGDRVFGFKDDDHGFGGHAQYTCMPEDAMMAKVPDELSLEEAAPGLEGAHYALFYIRSAEIAKDTRVLLNGSTGTIGNAALQIMLSMGANVTAVCSNPHIDTIKSQGAISVVDYTMDDFTELEEEFDVVFDAVGKSTFGSCKGILKKYGIYTSSELGPFCQNPILALLTPLFGKQQVHFPIPNNNSQEDANYLASLMQTKQYKPMIDRTYSLEDIVDAFKYVETGEKFGNVVIKMP